MEQYGSELEGELYQPEKKDLREDSAVIINGIPSEHSKVLDQKIVGDTVITLMPVFYGGG